MTSIDIGTTSLGSSAATFVALSESIRLSTLDQLSQGQRCVGQRHEAPGIAPNLLAYHLRTLCESGPIEACQGRWVDDRRCDDATATVAKALPVSFLEGVLE